MRIAVVATGGTIASRQDARGDLVPVDRAADLFSRVETDRTVTLDCIDLDPTPSFAAGLDHMVAVALRIRGLLAEGCGAVIVTHGTDSLEEMAFVAAHLLPMDAPVVLTGAQRPADHDAPDGPENLRDALAAAVAGLPVCVVMHGRAIAAVEARKVHTSDALAFSGGPAGALALIDNGKVIPLSRPVRGATYAGLTPGPLPRVDVVTVGAGTDGLHIDASVAAGAAGIVIEAFGRGNADPRVVAAVARATGLGIQVLVTSRVGAGLVEPLYGAGGGADLARAGAVFGGDLTAPRARVALSLALAHPELGPATKQVEQMWRTHA